MSSHKTSRLELPSWCLFDVANSAYTTIIVTVAFNVIFTKLIVGADATGALTRGNTLWAWVLAASWGTVALLGPPLGSWSDSRARRKQLLAASVILCCAASFALCTVSPGDVGWAIALVFLSNVGYSLSENFISAFLPHVARPDQMGRVSGLAWGLGYFGGLGSILLCRHFTGLDYSLENFDRLRLTGPLVAAFFAIASLPALLFLREPRSAAYGEKMAGPVQTWRRLRGLPDLAALLTSCFFFQGGLAIVISFAAIYGEQELRLSGADQALFFVSLQLTAAAGAFGFGALQSRWGGMRALNLSLWVWVVTVVLIYALKQWTAWVGISERVAFLIVGNLAGLCLGGTQACARALVGQFSPAARAGEVFGLWGFSSKLSMVFALFFFGMIQSAVGLRLSLVFCAALFGASLLIHLRIDEKRGRRASQSLVAGA